MAQYVYTMNQVGKIVPPHQCISILKGMGVRFSLDDFGSGLSSFAYLKNLPVDYVKIDGSFVRGIATNQIDHKMVQAINQMAHTMDIRTIARTKLPSILSFIPSRSILPYWAPATSK